MPPLIAAAVAAAFPATLATVGGAVGGVTYASVIGSVLFTAASVALMYALAPKPPKQTVKTMIKVPDAPRFTVYGTEVQLGGVCVMYVAKPKGRLLWIVTVTGDGPIGGFSFFKLNGKLVELAPDGNVKTRPYNLRDNAGRDSRARIWTRNGTDTQTSTRDDPASSTETAHLGIDWTSDHRLRGISYAMTEFLVCKDAKAQSAVFPSGVPEQKYGIIGRAVWDFRDPLQDPDIATTWLVSNNPVLIRVDYLRRPVAKGGRSIPLAKIDLPSHTIAADRCDEPIALKGGGTIPRYAFRGIQDYQTRFADVLAMIDATCDGQTYRTEEGKLGYRIGGPLTIPDHLIFSTDDESIIGYHDMRQGAGRVSAFNIAKLKFTSPNHEFAFLPCQDWREEAWIAFDGLERPVPLEIEECYAFAQMRRLAKIYTRKANPEWQGTITTTLKGLRAFYAPGIRVQIPELELDLTCEVLGITPHEDGGACDVTFRSLAADTYDWDPLLEEGEEPPPIPSDSDSGVIEPPTDPNFVVGAGPMIYVAADQRSFDPGDLIIRWADAGVGNWTPDHQGVDNHAVTDVLTAGADYDIQLKWRVKIGSQNAAYSAWTGAVTVTATVDTTPLVAATLLDAVLDEDGAYVSWTNSVSSSAWTNTLYRGSVTSPSLATAVETIYGSRGEAMAYADDGVTEGTYIYFVRTSTPDGVTVDSDIITVSFSGVVLSGNVLGAGNDGDLIGAGAGDYLGWGPL
jgi:hypothetical protein